MPMFMRPTKRQIAFEIWIYLDTCISQARRAGALAYANEAFVRRQQAWTTWQQAQMEEYRPRLQHLLSTSSRRYDNEQQRTTL